MESKSINSINKSDLLTYPLWGYIPSKDGSLWLKPVKSLTNLKNRMVTADITLANGRQMLGLIESLKLDSPNWAKHNRRLWLFIEEGNWFRLTQYFHYEENDPHGPEALSKELNLNIQDVFPVHFNAERYLNMNKEILSGYFEIFPSWGVSLESCFNERMKKFCNDTQHCVSRCEATKKSGFLLRARFVSKAKINS